MAITPVNLAQITNQPNAPTALPTSPPGLLGKIGGFVKGAAQGIGQPFYKMGAMTGNAILGTADALGLLPAQASTNLKNIQQNGLKNTPFGNVDVPTVDVMGNPFSDQNIKAVKSAAGTGVKIGTTLGAGEVPQATGFLGRALSQGTSGAIGAGGNALGGSMEQNLGLQDTLMNTAKGAAIGFGTGAVTGLATEGVSKIANHFNPAGDLNTDHPIFKSKYDANVANTTAENTQAGVAATDSIHEASNTVNDMTTGAGNQYAQAPNIISKADPEAGTTASIDLLHQMQSLKDTKAWSLPDSVREALPTEIDGPIKFSPQQSQDIIKSLNDLKFNSKGDVIVNQQTSQLVNDFKDAAQSGMGHVIDPQGNSVWNRMSQDYQQVVDAKDALSKIIPIKRFQGEILDPTEVNSSVNKMMKMMETPQGTAALIRSNAEVQAATGYDILNDPMGAVHKLVSSNKELETAMTGNYMHQLTQAVKNPTKVGSRLLYMTGSLLGIVALGTAFRKQIGAFISGQ